MRTTYETDAPERVETVIIGAGQAGLSVGYHLARRGKRFVILEAHDRVGDSWRTRWDSLRLFSPAKFDGLDGPVLPTTPDFVKALDVDHARDGEVLLAWAMNGADLPWLNGYPLRVVVPGYYGTYWMKHVHQITVIDTELDSFWMKTAYRIPDNECACVPPGGKPDKTVPIARLDVRSFITNLADGAKLKSGAATMVRGIAFDGGHGIKEVELSSDGGKTWKATQLGRDLGKYSFRPWQTTIKLPAGTAALMVRATSRSGEVQPMEPRWNPAGYMRNVVETVHVEAA